MNLIAAERLEGVRVVCAFLDREGDDRPEWLLCEEGVCVAPARGRRVWVRFKHPCYTERFENHIMDWRELEPVEGA
ncbi:MAG: hypothetical protein ACYTEQ_30740 [Planctomycetota bacterium]|jgi:hypothetical protein